MEKRARIEKSAELIATRSVSIDDCASVALCDTQVLGADYGRDPHVD